MKRLGEGLYGLLVSLSIVALVLGPAPVYAQIIMGGGGAQSSTFGSAIFVPTDDDCAAPEYSFTGATNQGIVGHGSGVIIAFAGGCHFLVNNTNVNIPASMSVGFTSNTVLDSLDAFWTRDGAASLQLGADANGAVVAQTIKSPDGITGTDIAGANITIAGGRSTGAGIGGSIVHQTAPNGATGTTATVLETRDYLHAGAKAVADNTATPFVDIGVVTDDAGSVQVFYEIKTENATDQQVISGIATVAYYNDGGTEACGTIVEAGETFAVSTGTITATVTCTVALTDEVRLNITSDTSLNTALTLRWRIIGGTIGAVQPQ